MTKNDRLASVPDREMLPLYRAIVAFLGREAQQRGWQDVASRLLAVESVLEGSTDRSGPA